MAGVSILDVLQEQARQTLTSDDQFYRKMPYLFKLCTQGGSGSTGFDGTAYFPLPVNPTEVTYDFPFAVEVTALQDSGVVAEEGGLVIGNLSISATTGFKLRKARDTSRQAGGGKMTGLMGRDGLSDQELSGQLHMWRLVHRCFDAYGECKKDPEIAHRTTMEFHGLKDKLHWQIIPRKFTIKRDKSEYRVSYGLTVQCDIVGEAEQPDSAFLFSDDRSLLQRFDDAISAVRDTIQQIEAAVDDLSASLDAIQRSVSNVVNILEDVGSVVSAGVDFVNGVKSFFSIPKKFTENLANSLDNMREDVNNAMPGLPATDDPMYQLYTTVSELTDNIDTMIALSKTTYATDLDGETKEYIKRVQPNTQYTDAQQETMLTAQADGTVAAGTQSLKQTFGNEFSPGDATRTRGLNPEPELRIGEYTGFREQTITQGDTLQSLAVKHLGSANKWKDIAIVNKLQPPYLVNSVRMPNTLRVNDPIMIPISNPVSPVNVPITGESAQGKSQIDKLLGEDILVIGLTNKKYGWVIDTAHGSTDVLSVSGLDNLKQGLEKRLRTEYGTNLSFPNVGLLRLVGSANWGDLYTEARFIFHQQILADPRIQSIADQQFRIEEDVFWVDIDAVPIGFDTSRQIPVQLT